MTASRRTILGLLVGFCEPREKPIRASPKTHDGLPDNVGASAISPPAVLVGVSLIACPAVTELGFQRFFLLSLKHVC
jgi:hypothetical protein